MVKPKKRRRQHSIQKYRHLLLEPLEDRRLLTSGLELLKDIHPNPQKEEGMLRPIQVGDYLYFVRSSEIYGWELWKSDGTPEGSSMVKDIFPGQAMPSDSLNDHVTHLTSVHENLFFRASDGVHGFELWKSDGTAQGTHLVKDIRPGSSSSISLSVNTSGLTNVNGTLFFVANDGTHGSELWKSDGTEQGTMMVKDIAWGTLGSNPRGLINVSGTLFFEANDGVNGLELWKSDGTPEGTVLVKDIRSGIASSRTSSFSAMANVNGTLFFQANDGLTGPELWKSNGTAVGTVLVKDIRVGGSGASPANLTNVNGTLFLSAQDGASGNELWKSDGSTAGTLMVKDIEPGATASYPQQFTTVNGALYFTAITGSTGRELWKSDGTSLGTVLVKDIRPGSQQSYSRYLTNANGSLYFVANDGTSGMELWKSDGTSVGTERLTNIYPLDYPENPRDIIGFQDQVYFSARVQLSSDEIRTDVWSTNGSAIGTNIKIAAVSRGSFSFATRFEILGDGFAFGADNGILGSELWKTDGTGSGTQLIKDINPGNVGSQWSQFRMSTLQGEVLLIANDGTHGNELWKSDGTESGTTMLKDIRPGNTGSYPLALVKGLDQVYFMADDGVYGSELWKSDGTTSGTTLLKDLRLGTIGSYPIPMAFLDGVLFFAADDGVHGSELWKSDGTTSNAALVKDIFPGSGSSSPFGIGVNGMLYFTAKDGIHGYELWRSDGTESGTGLVKDIRPGDASSNASELVNVNGTLYFSADDGTNGTELWKSDGTTDGTVMVKNINSNMGSTGAATHLRYLVNVNGILYFSANDGVHGEELWTSDGTTEGTRMVFDLTDDSGGSMPQVVGELSDGKLLVLATTAAHGRELYMLDLASAQTNIQAASVYHAGSSFASSGIQNALDTSKQLAKEGNEPLTLTYDNLINSSRSINGLVFDIQNLPSIPSANLTIADFEFQMSPTGAFIEADHPPAGWGVAPVPSSISILPGSQGSPDRVVLQWPDNAIANRWLRVTVKATANTGLLVSEVYYIGHLLGETTGASGGVYTVSFADITPIRSAVGQSVSASSIHDIDKNGTVSFADISAMRPNVGAQLTNITIPADNASSCELGGERLSSLQSGTGKGRVGGAGGWSLLQMPTLPMSSILPATNSRPMIDRPDVIKTHSGLPERKPLLKTEGVETRDPWLGELDVLLEDAAIVRYWTSESAVEEAGIELLRLSTTSFNEGS